MQLLREEEGRLDVEVHDLVPAGFGEVEIIDAPGSPGVVDENVELAFAARQFFHQRLDPVDGRQIALDADHPVAQFGAGFLDLVDLARADVDAVDARGEEALDNHLADAAAAASHQRNAPLEAEQVF